MSYPVVVTGGRSYRNRKRLAEVLSALELSHQDLELWHGAARGADLLAATWALRHGVPTRAFRAEWERFGVKAGPWRNQQMIDAGPKLVIAFPGGAGTADCVRRAERAGIPVRRVLD